jgi:hypothetical protein
MADTQTFEMDEVRAPATLSPGALAPSGKAEARLGALGEAGLCGALRGAAECAFPTKNVRSPV